MNKIYTSLLLISGSFLAITANCQNVRAVQTSTNPQPKQVNNTSVIVIPKNESNNTQKNNNGEKQQGDSNRSVRKVENKNQQEGNRKKQVSRPSR